MCVPDISLGHHFNGATESGSGSWCEADEWGPGCWAGQSLRPSGFAALEQIFSPFCPKNSGASARAS